MLIKKKQSKKVSNSDECKVYEYSCPSEEFSFSIAEIDGRYPKKGKVSNTLCEEIYYITSGEVEIFSEKGRFKLEEGDFYHFEKGEKYYVVGKKVKIVLVNVPKWNENQHKFYN